MKFIEKHTKLILILIFLLGIIIYGFIASKMTNTPYLNVDEELYISMARSFFFEHNFSKGYEILNYKCVIYSMIISIAYLFGAGAKLIFTMRFIGVCLMISSIFPIYLLAKEILKDKKKAILVSFCSLFIPEFTLSFYVVQEVLSYPIFLWIAYFVYLKFTRENTRTIDIILPILFAIIYFVKSYTIVFGLAYFITLGIIVLKDKKYRNIGKIVLSLIVFGLAFVLFTIRS